MVDKVFKTILLFTPIAYCIGVGWYKFELVFFQIASIMLFMASMFDTPKRTFKLKKLIALFLGICLFSVMVNGFQNKSLSALINIFLGCADILILSMYSKDLKKCLNWLMAGLGINALIFVGQVYGYSPFIDPNTFTGSTGEVVKGEFGGIIGNSPRFACFIALALPFVNRWYLIPAIGLGLFLGEASIFISIFILLSKTAIYHFDKEGKIIALIIGILALLVFYKHIGHAFSIRLEAWKGVIDQLAQRPWAGFGLGSYQLTDYAMSSFMQWLYGVGLIGIGFIVLCLRRIKWYMIPLVFLCLVEYPFEIPRLWFVLIFIIAYYAIEQKEDLLC